MLLHPHFQRGHEQLQNVEQSVAVEVPLDKLEKFPFLLEILLLGVLVVAQVAHAVLHFEELDLDELCGGEQTGDSCQLQVFEALFIGVRVVLVHDVAGQKEHVLVLARRNLHAVQGPVEQLRSRLLAELAVVFQAVRVHKQLLVDDEFLHKVYFIALDVLCVRFAQKLVLLFFSQRLEFMVERLRLFFFSKGV